MELTIEVKSKQGKFQELYQTFQALLPTLGKEEGCREFHVHQDAEDGETFTFSAHWEEQTDFEQYIRSNSGSALLGAMELLCETARVRLDRDAPWEGIEALKRMRKQTGKAG